MASVLRGGRRAVALGFAAHPKRLNVRILKWTRWPLMARL